MKFLNCPLFAGLSSSGLASQFSLQRSGVEQEDDCTFTVGWGIQQNYQRVLPAVLQ